MSLIKKPLIVFALVVNLVLGFLCICTVKGHDMSSLVLMYTSYAFVAVMSLLWGFGRIHALSTHCSAGHRSAMPVFRQLRKS